MNEQQYIRGFNSGFLLAQFEPKLLDTVTKNLHSMNEYLEGLFDGREEFEIEQTRLQSEELKRLRTRSQDREIDLDKEL
jgi:hypothetical protein